MRRAWVATAAALLSACGTTSGTVVCGPCAGPGYAVTGVPDVLRHAFVTLCVAGQPCRTARRPVLLRARSLQYVPLPSGVGWQHYDGTSVTLEVRTRHSRWHGTGAFVYTPDDGDPCSCAGLAAEVHLSAG
jgi:hypothetical protein